MVLTGWTEAQLGQASHETVHGLYHRITATRLWSPEVREMYYAAPLRTGTAAEKGRHTGARQAAKALHDSLFPED